MEKIQPQPSLDPSLPETEGPVVLPCVLEIVHKIENYSETSNLEKRVSSVKDSVKDVSSAGLTKEKKLFPRIARTAEQESSGDKGEQVTNEKRPKEIKKNNKGDNASKLTSKTIDPASMVINNEMSLNLAEGRESRHDVCQPDADKHGRARELRNGKEMNCSSSSRKRKYFSRNHSISKKRNLMYQSIIRKYYSSLKKYVRNFIDKTKVSTIHRSHQVAMLMRKDPKKKAVPSLKEGELIMRNMETRSASRRMRRKRKLQVNENPYDDFSDESSGLDKTTWRSYRIPKRRNHFTNCGKRRRPRMKRHIPPARIDSSSSDETPVVKTSSDEAPVHAHAPAIVESVNDIGFIREHRSGAEVLPVSETIIKNLEEFVHGKKRNKKTAPRVYLFGVPKKHRKIRDYECYSDADSLICLSDEEDIISKEVKGGKKYYMKHVKSHSRSVFKIPGTLIRKIKNMWKLEHNQHLYSEEEQACESSDVIIIRKPKYKIRGIPRHYVCKDCDMRSRGALLKDPFVYNVTNTAGIFSEEKIENKRNEVEGKVASGTCVISALPSTDNRQSTLDESILQKLIGYNDFEYHCLNCKCDDCKLRKIPTNFRTCPSKIGKEEACHSKTEWKTRAAIENPKQCCRCSRNKGEGRVGRKFIFYEREFSKLTPPKEMSPPAASNRVDNCPSSSTPIDTGDGSCPIKGETDDAFFCEEKQSSNVCIVRGKNLKKSEVKVNRCFRAGVKRNNRGNSRKKGR